MPVDHKRVNGPENSEPYQLFSDARKKVIQKEVDTILKGLRSDGRQADELRKICELFKIIFILVGADFTIAGYSLDSFSLKHYPEIQNRLYDN